VHVIMCCPTSEEVLQYFGHVVLCTFILKSSECLVVKNVSASGECVFRVGQS